ncbi:uncharacterized protein G2W53_037208 [Senna tora]|uniref:Uncharacterized protein n=1 Tax=Senna tora TaxID=362788 RepID=A0A834SX41_9FABA|nr:uncharacterized protein G2W53_037208 [Senna tora]
MIPTQQPPWFSDLKQLLTQEFANLFAKLDENRTKMDWKLDAPMGVIDSSLTSLHTKCEKLEEGQELQLSDPTASEPVHFLLYICLNFLSITFGALVERIMDEGTLEAKLGAVLSELLKCQRALVGKMTEMEERTTNIEAMVRQIFQDEFGQECMESKHSNREERFEPCEEFSLDFGRDGNLEDESRSELVMSKVAMPKSLLDEVQPNEVIEDHSHI